MKQSNDRLQDNKNSVHTLESFVGKQGTTITVLRPVGVVRIDGERIDAMAETGSIEADCEIKVTSVYDNQVKVRTVSPQE